MEKVDINFLAEVCTLMQRFGLIGTQAQFSVQMLGKQPSYMSAMKARHLTPSASVLNVLSSRIAQRVSQFESNAHLGKDYAVLLNASYTRLKSIQNLVESQVFGSAQLDRDGLSKIRDNFGKAEPTLPANRLGKTIVAILQGGLSKPQNKGI